MRWQRDAGGQDRVGLRGLPGRGERQHASPDGQASIRAVTVVGRPGADLHRGLGQRQRQQGGRGEFLLVRLAGVVPLAGHDVLGQRTQAGQLLRRVGDQPRRAVDHRAAVVDRVLEDRPGQHQAVHVGHGDADRRLGRGDQAAAGHRAVQVDHLAGHAVDSGKHHRVAVHHDPEMTDHPGPQDVVQVPPAGAALLAQAAVRGAGGDGEVGRFRHSWSLGARVPRDHRAPGRKHAARSAEWSLLG